MQFFTHFGVFCVIARSLLKNTDLNITECLTKILLFPEDCASLGLSQDLSDKKKQFIKYGNIPLGEHFNLRYSKLKSDYWKLIKSAYVIGLVHYHFYHSVKVITPRKKKW